MNVIPIDVGTGLLTPLVVRNNPATPGPTRITSSIPAEHVLLGGTDRQRHPDRQQRRRHALRRRRPRPAGRWLRQRHHHRRRRRRHRCRHGRRRHHPVRQGPRRRSCRPGPDLVVGSDGHDFIFLGTDMGSEAFAGVGNDFILGNKTAEHPGQRRRRLDRDRNLRRRARRQLRRNLLA